MGRLFIKICLLAFLLMFFFYLMSCKQRKAATSASFIADDRRFQRGAEIQTSILSLHYDLTYCLSTKGIPSLHYDLTYCLNSDYSFPVLPVRNSIL